LGENDFFMLLATQLRNQDPLSPMENTEYISQLAQFSSLEAVKNLSDAFALFTQGQAIAQASALLGKQVEGLDPHSGQTVSGTVSAVSLEDDTVMVQIGDVEIPLTNVAQVTQ
jgi:flagellar basal-body rod modification protein FlgD